MQITHYSFGKLEIGGKAYTQDLIVFPPQIKENWWRKNGHSLAKEDLAEILPNAPFTLIVGTGASGLMEVPQVLKTELAELGITLLSFPTPQAVLEFNLRAGKEKVAGAFHLTC